MSTGKGIFHSEYNGSDKEQLEFLQIWVFPRIENTEPEYNNYDIRPLLKRNELALIISPDGKVPASIKQDAWFSMGTFDAGKSFEYKLIRKVTEFIFFSSKEMWKLQATDCHDVTASVFGIQRALKWK